LLDNKYQLGSISFLPHICHDQVKLIEYQTEVNKDDNKVKFCDIKDWGPKQTIFGQKFLQQPDGNSAFWVLTDCAPKGTVIRFDGYTFKTMTKLPTMTTSLDDELFIKEPKLYALDLYHPDSDSSKTIGMFNVIPSSKEPLIVSAKNKNIASSPSILLAHAGGGLNGQTYLNSLDALDYNYQLGHRFFELDFSWTSDKQLVAIHDWKHTYKKYFNQDADKVPDLKDFMSLKMNHGQTQIGLSNLDAWLLKHPDAYIVTDVRGNNIQALKLMKKQMKSALKQVIPQMYHPSNYDTLQAMGYDNIIFTLYATHLPTEQIIKFIKENKLHAVTVHPSKDGFKKIVDEFNGTNTFVY